MTKYKIIFYTVWLALIFLGIFTVFVNTPFSGILQNKAALANVIQRTLGLTAFTMMFTQIILGSYMSKWIEKYGPWIFKFHVFEGILAYIIIFLHPVFFMLFNYFAGRGFDPFFTFIDVCVLCSTKTDFYYTLGRVGFWLVTIGVFAGLFRTATPFMRMHWRKFHILNYIAFLIVGLHGFFLGTDFTVMPFVLFAAVAYIAVLATVVIKSASLLKKA